MDIRLSRFNVRVVRKGDRYGLNNCLVHDKSDPLVEFYDTTHGEQFVSRYYRSTLLSDNGPRSLDRTGLCLDGGYPEWSVGAVEMGTVLGFLRSEVRS